MKRRSMRRRGNGFTLIELMITVAIVGLLTAIAYPAYQEQVRRAKRAEGKTALLKAAQLQERIYITGDPTVPNSIATYADNNRLPTLFGLGAGAVVNSSENPADPDNKAAYTITVDAPNAACPIASCFVLRATPKAGVFADAKCDQLTLTSTGIRGETGTGTMNECWSM